MREAHIIQHFSFQGGIEVLVEEVLRHRIERGCPTHIYSLQPKRQTIKDDAFLDQYITYGEQQGLSWSVLMQLVTWLKAHQIEVVITHHLGPLLYGGLAARLAGIEHRIHVDHDAWYANDRHDRWLHHLGFWLMRPKWVAVSETVKRQWQCYTNHPCQVILNGINTKRFCRQDKTLVRKHLSLPDDVYLVGFVGRLESVKGPDQLLEAMHRLPNHVHAAIVGRGSMLEALHDQVKAFALQDRVHFLGYREDTENVYPALDVLCVPSRNEGYPLSILEAQSCGLPVVAFDVGGVRDCFQVHQNGLVPEGDIQALAQALLQAASEDPQHIKAVCDHIEAHNSLGAMICAYESLYHGA